MPRVQVRSCPITTEPGAPSRAFFARVGWDLSHNNLTMPLLVGHGFSRANKSTDLDQGADA